MVYKIIKRKAMLNLMTPEEFKNKMAECVEDNKNDACAKHVNMDSLMCELLCALGYQDGIDIFLEQDRWYA